MRALKILTIVMAVMIVAGVVVLGVMINRKLSGPTTAAPANGPPVAVLLEEPAGTRIVATTASQDRLALQLQGGGPDRVVVLDPRTGQVTARIGLAH